MDGGSGAERIASDQSPSSSTAGTIRRFAIKEVRLSGIRIIRGYDAMQVCLNGHVITDEAVTHDEKQKPFCPDCGAETIIYCPECQETIPGAYKDSGHITHALHAPNNCHECGTAYPWRQAAIASAIEVLQMDLEGQDAADAADLVKAVSVETPGAEVAALKLKRLLVNLGSATYEVAIKVLSDVAAETAKKTLWPKV